MVMRKAEDPVRVLRLQKIVVLDRRRGL